MLPDVQRFSHLITLAAKFFNRKDNISLQGVMRWEVGTRELLSGFPAMYLPEFLMTVLEAISALSLLTGMNPWRLVFRPHLL